jgi:hypothetical protein
MLRRLAPAFVAVFALLAPAAHAGTVTMDGTVAVYTADPGETNELDAQTDDYGTVPLSERNRVKPSGIPGCTGSGPSLDCALNASGLRIDLGDQDDKASVTGSDGQALTVDGGDGDDTLTITGAPVRALGGAGDDLLDMTGANAAFAGGPGNDLLMNRSKASVDCAGGGVDKAFKPLVLTRTGCLPPAPIKIAVKKRQTINSFIVLGLQFSAGCSRPCAIRWVLRPDNATRRLLHTGTPFFASSGEPVDEAGYPDLAPPGLHRERSVLLGPATKHAIKRAARIGMTLELSGSDGITPLQPRKIKLTLR